MNARLPKFLRAGAVALLTSMLLSHVALGEPRERNARSDIEEITHTINIRGLDLSTPAGAERLYRQIVITAKNICWRRGHHGAPLLRTYELRQARKCFDEAVREALAQVNEVTGTDLERVAGLDRAAVVGRFAAR